MLKPSVVHGREGSDKEGRAPHYLGRVCPLITLLCDSLSPDVCDVSRSASPRISPGFVLLCLCVCVRVCDSTACNLAQGLVAQLLIYASG